MFATHPRLALLATVITPINMLLVKRTGKTVPGQHLNMALSGEKFGVMVCESIVVFEMLLSGTKKVALFSYFIFLPLHKLQPLQTFGHLSG